MATDPDWRAEATFVAAPASVSSARDFVTQQLVEHQLLYLVEDVRLVLSELATTIISAAASTRFTVTVSASADELRLTTTAVGASANSAVGMPPVLGLAGSGSTIVDHLTRDRGGIADGRGAGELWASFAVRVREPSSATGQAPGRQATASTR
jgi:hypothetical protein